MTPPQPIGYNIGAMSSSRVILGELLSSRARLRFPGHAQPATPNSRPPSKVQRTAYRAFPTCLTQGGHSTLFYLVNPPKPPKFPQPTQTKRYKFQK